MIHNGARRARLTIEQEVGGREILRVRRFRQREFVLPLGLGAPVTRAREYDGDQGAERMPTSRIITDQELMQLPEDGRKYELVDGQVQVSPAGGRHGQVAVALILRLASYVNERRLGHVLESSTGYRLPGGNVRSPDVSFVAAGRFANEQVPIGFIELVPDLAVEVLSPEDRRKQVLAKVGEFLDAGVRLVWVIDADKGRASVYRSITDVRVIGLADELEGEDVVPGFRCLLGDLLP